MQSANYSRNLSIGGISLQTQTTRTFDHVNNYGPITLAVAQVGSLTTRTSDTVGTITMASGAHTIVTGQIIDIYWASGLRHEVTVGNVSGTSVPISLGAGDVLPTASTAVQVGVRKTINTNIDGDAVEIIGILAKSTDSNSVSKAHVQFDDSGGAEIEELDLVANDPRISDIAGGDVNGFTGNPITVCYASNGSTAETLDLYIASGVDSTP